MGDAAWGRRRLGAQLRSFVLQDAESVADVVVWGTLFPVLRDEAVPVGKSWVRLLLRAARPPGGLLGWEPRGCGIVGAAFSLLQDFMG